MIKEWFSDVAKLLFPKVCVLCKQDLISEENHLCSLCLSELPQTNFTNHSENVLTNKLKGRFDFEKANALYYFNIESKVQDILHEVKYKSNEQLAYYLGELLALKLKDSLKEIDVIIPVPLHKKRILERGYNQSALLAEGLGARLNIEVEEGVVQRKKHTETQTKKNRSERVENMKNAFQWDTAVRNKRILFLDDVITTGATLESLVLAMPAEWNNQVNILSFAAAIES